MNRYLEERPFSAVTGPDGRTLVVSGVSDELAVADFRRELQRCVNGSSDAVVVDLSDVDLLPSMAVGVLVGAMNDDRVSVTAVARKGCFAAAVLSVCGVPFETREEGPKRTK